MAQNRSDHRSSPRQLAQAKRRRGAFTLVELITVIAISTALIALIFSVGMGARRHSNNVMCVNNLRQISVASVAYSAEHRGEWPRNQINDVVANEVFLESLLPYFEHIPKKPSPDFRRSPFVCPAERTNEPDGQYSFQGAWVVRSRGLSYAQNSYLPSTLTNRRVGLRNAVQHPQELVLYMDFQGHYLMDVDRLGQGNRIAQIKARHGESANAAFADGSVRPVLLDTIPTTLPSLFWQGRQ